MYKSVYCILQIHRYNLVVSERKKAYGLYLMKFWFLLSKLLYIPKEYALCIDLCMC